MMRDMTYDPSAWERVAEAVRKRREDDLGLSQMEVATAGDLSLDRVSSIERARATGYRGATLRALERALKWAPRSIDAILSGGEPTLLNDGLAPIVASATGLVLPQEVALIRSAWQGLGESAAWAAARTGITERRWNEVMNGMVVADVQELALMARAVGMRSRDMRRAGHAELANRLQDLELNEEYGSKTAAELDAESLAILAKIHAAIAPDREGLDDTGLQITDQQAAGLAMAVAALRRRRRDAS